KLCYRLPSPRTRRPSQEQLSIRKISKLVPPNPVRENHSEIITIKAITRIIWGAVTGPSSSYFALIRSGSTRKATVLAYRRIKKPQATRTNIIANGATRANHRTNYYVTQRKWDQR